MNAEVATRLRVVFEGEATLPGQKCYWVGRAGESTPFGQIVTDSNTADQLFSVANGGGSSAQRELRLAARSLLRERLAMATGRHDPLVEARAWDRFALALDAAEDSGDSA